jgi:ABC-type branched-subunit amino acid transport system substrate-binding protein
MQACARKAAEDPQTVAVISNNSTMGAVTDPILEQAGLACLGCQLFSTTSFKSPVYFPITGGLLNVASQGSIATDVLKKDKFGLPQVESSANATIVGLVNGVMQSTGRTGKVVSNIPIPISQVDVSAKAAQLQSDGANVLLDAATQDVYSRLLQAMKQQNIDIPKVVSAGVYGPGEAKTELNGLNSNLYIAAEWKQSSKGFKEFTADAKKYKIRADNYNDSVALPWIAAKLQLGEIIKGIGSGDINRQAVLAGASKLKTDFKGMIPMTDFSATPTPVLGGLITRMFNPTAIAYQYKNGKFVPIDKEQFVNVALPPK